MEEGGRHEGGPQGSSLTVGEMEAETPESTRCVPSLAGAVTMGKAGCRGGMGA